MEQQNKLMKKTLINQYSKLSYTNPFELSERVKSKEWWVKETYRLKVHSNLSKAAYVIILLILSSYMVSACKFSGSFWNVSMPITSIFIFLILIRAISQVEERVRLFAVMKLVFWEKKEVVDPID